MKNGVYKDKTVDRKPHDNIWQCSGPYTQQLQVLWGVTVWLSK